MFHLTVANEDFSPAVVVCSANGWFRCWNPDIILICLPEGGWLSDIASDNDLPFINTVLCLLVWPALGPTHVIHVC